MTSPILLTNPPNLWFVCFEYGSKKSAGVEIRIINNDSLKLPLLENRPGWSRKYCFPTVFHLSFPHSPQLPTLRMSRQFHLKVCLASTGPSDFRALIKH